MTKANKTNKEDRSHQPCAWCNCQRTQHSRNGCTSCDCKRTYMQVGEDNRL